MYVSQAACYVAGVLVISARGPDWVWGLEVVEIGVGNVVGWDSVVLGLWGRGRSREAVGGAWGILGDMGFVVDGFSHGGCY